jgi:hypothetical protein
MNKGSFHTPATTLVMVAFAILILSTSDLSQAQRRPLKGGVSQNEQQGDVFNSNSRRGKPCDPNDCPCRAAQAVEFHEKDCEEHLADFDRKIEGRLEEIRQINAYPQMRKSKINPAKDPDILQYRYYKAQYQKYCECSKKYLEKMCSLTPEELYWAQSDCSETGGTPYRPYPSEEGPHDAERRDGSRTETNIHYDLSLGVVCWINARYIRFIWPLDAAWALLSWPNRVAIGLVATANDEPPFRINDPGNFTNPKDYRAMLWCKLGVDIDRQTDKVVRVQMYSQVIDAGWTPPPDPNKVAMGAFMPLPRDGKYHQGERSPISGIYVQKRHPNSALGPIQTGEQLLVDGLVKFRAGKPTDDIGISNDVGSPYHVPWTWSEMALTYASGGEFYIYLKGAVFPTHTFYLNGLRIRELNQNWVGFSDKEIAFTTGAPKNMPQPYDPPQITGPVITHKYTLPANKDSPGKESHFLPPTSRPWPRGVR